MTYQDPRVEMIRRVLAGLWRRPDEVLDALNSLDRDARKAALAEAVVEAAEEGYKLFDRVNALELTTHKHEAEIQAADQRIRDALAAFRAEFPAEPRDTTETT